MSESEKLTMTVTEFETEVAGLTADIAEIEQQLATATTTAETAIATAERRADEATQRAAVDAEQERARLAGTLGRKRLALTAATADLAAARHGAAASQKAAALVQLQTLADELGVTAAVVDAQPFDLAAWSALKRQMDDTQRLYRRAGGNAQLFGDLAAMAQSIIAAYGQAVAVTVKDSPTGPRDVEIPQISGLLRLNRARTLVGELVAGN